MPRSKSVKQPDNAQVVSISTPSDLVSSVPYLVGFHPRESLVALALRPPRGRLGLALRLDLPENSAHRAQFGRVVAGHLATDGATQAILVIYTDAADPPADRTGRAIVDAVAAELSERDIELRDAVLVRDGHWWSYLCGDIQCCPTEGTPVPEQQDSPVAPVMAVEGRVVHSDRADLAASLTRTDEGDDKAVADALERAARVSSSVRDGKVLDDELARRRALWHEGTGNAFLLPDRVAALGLALRDPMTRDCVIALCLGADVEAYEPLWLELTRRLPAPFDAIPATLLGMLAYLRGDGPFARTCFDHALASNPAYSFAELLNAQVNAGTHPARVRPLLQEAFDASSAPDAS